jgi:hypothetical protein
VDKLLKRFAQAGPPPEEAAAPPAGGAPPGGEGAGAPPGPADLGALPGEAPGGAPGADPAAGGEPAPGGEAGGAPPGDPAAGGGEQGGAMPPPGGGGGGGAPPDPNAAPAAPGGKDATIARPIDEPFELYADSKAISLLMDDGLEKATDRIWEMYGGEPKTGKVFPGRVGERSDNYIQMSDADRQKEIAATESERWKRLLKGKTIADVITYDDLKNQLGGALANKVLQRRPPDTTTQDVYNKQMASTMASLIRLARRSDTTRSFAEGDKADMELFKILAASKRF